MGGAVEQLPSLRTILARLGLLDIRSCPVRAIKARRLCTADRFTA